MASLPATQAATRGTYFTKSWFGVKPDLIKVSPSLITQVAQGKYVYVIVLGVQPPILALFLSFDPPVVSDQTLSYCMESHPLGTYPAVLPCHQQGKRQHLAWDIRPLPLGPGFKIPLFPMYLQKE